MKYPGIGFPAREHPVVGGTGETESAPWVKNLSDSKLWFHKNLRIP